MSSIAKLPVRKTTIAIAGSTARRIGEVGRSSLVLAILSPYLALRTGNLRKLLLAILLLDIPLQWDINVLFREDLSKVGSLEGMNLSLTTVCLAGLYALWLSGGTNRTGRRSNFRMAFQSALTLYCAVSTASWLVASDKTVALFEIFLFLQMFLLYVYIAATVRTRQEVVYIITLLVAGLLLESLVMIGLHFHGDQFNFAGINGRVDIASEVEEVSQRVGGTVGSPNNTGSYLSVLLAVTFGILLSGLGRWHRWLALAALSFGGVALVLTYSRAAWIGFTLSLLILFLMAARRRWLSPKVVGMALMGMVLLTGFFHSEIQARLLGDDRGSAHSRIPLMELAWEMIKHNWVLGVGANNFAVVMDDYITPEVRGEWLYTVHNKYLLVWAETGILGVVAYLAFLSGILRRGWQCWRLGDPLLSPLALGLTAGVVGMMYEMLVDVFRGRPLTQLLWLIAGLLTAIWQAGTSGQAVRESTPTIAKGRTRPDRAFNRPLNASTGEWRTLADPHPTPNRR